MDLPKVNIALAGSAIVAICSTLGGGVWYMSQQASVIEALQSDLEKLTVQNSAVDRTNLIRDVQKNSDDIQELIDILAEFYEDIDMVYEDMEDADLEIWADIDMVNEDLGGMAAHMMEIIKLQSRIAILEKTVEFTRNDGM